MHQRATVIGIRCWASESSGYCMTPARSSNRVTCLSPFDRRRRCGMPNSHAVLCARMERLSPIATQTSLPTKQPTPRQSEGCDAEPQNPWRRRRGDSPSRRHVCGEPGSHVKTKNMPTRLVQCRLIHATSLEQGSGVRVRAEQLPLQATNDGQPHRRIHEGVPERERDTEFPNEPAKFSFRRRGRTGGDWCRRGCGTRGLERRFGGHSAGGNGILVFAGGRGRRLASLLPLFVRPSPPFANNVGRLCGLVAEGHLSDGTITLSRRTR